MKKAALFAGVIAALICSTTLAAVISGVSAGSNSVYPTPVPAQYVAASYGSGLANESIAAGMDTALYCAMDNLDGTTSTPECGLNAIRHTGVGPGSTTNYLQATVATTTDIRAASGIWTECFIWRSDSLAAAQGIFSLATGATGRSVSVAATTGAVSYYVMSGGYVAASVGTIRAADTNLFCTGRDSAGKLYWNFNGTAGGGAVYSYTAPVGAQAEFARAGAVALNGHLFEYVFADAEPTPASLAAIWTSVSTCRTRGRCLPNIGTLTAGGTFTLVGDDYTIGSNWCGDSTCSRYAAPVGVVTTREARYSWPSLTPTQNGTVPRVATSGIHRQGYGARHAGLSGWSAANYLSLGTGAAPDVLDFTGDFTECAIIEPTPVDFSGYASIISNTNATTRGYELFASADFTLRARYWLPGVADAVSSTVIPNSTVAVCWGRQGTTGKVQVGGGVVGTVATVGYLPAGSAPALVGDNAARPAFTGKVHEIFATTTPASDEYLTYLTDAAMRCTTQGNCFPWDANTVMHCNGDEFTGSVLRCGVNTGADPWTTNGTVTLNAPSFYQNVTAQRISASGAGPYSAANSFQWGTGPDVLDFTGSWTVCSSFDVTTTSGSVVSGGYTAGGDGWTMTYVSGKLQCAVATVLGGAVAVDTSTNAGSDGSLNIGCCGWTRGSNIVSARLNASAIATQGGASFAPATTIPSYIGRRNAAGTELGGRVYEILALNKAPTTELLDTIHRRWLNHQSLTGQPLTNTHAYDTCKYHSGGTVVGRGANVQRQRSATRINSLCASTTPTVGTVTTVPPGYITMGATPGANIWTQSTATIASPYSVNWNATLTANAALAPDGTMTATTVREVPGKVTTEVYFDAGLSTTTYNATPAMSVYLRPVGPRNCAAILFGTYQWGVGWGRNAFIMLDIAADKLTLHSFGGSTNDFKKAVVGYEHLKDGWIRFWVTTDTVNISGAHYTFGLRLQPGTVCTYTEYATNASYGYDIWNPSLVEDIGSNLGNNEPLVAVPYSIPAGATCAGETSTLRNPLCPAGSTCTPSRNWCVRAQNAAPGYGWPWGGAVDAVLASSGTYASANSWNLRAYGSKIYFDSRGADAVAVSMSADHTFVAGSAHTIVACMNGNVGTIYYDGSFTPASTGSVATFTQWATDLTMGSTSIGAYSWNGTIGSLDLNSTGDPRDFVWDRRTP